MNERRAEPEKRRSEQDESEEARVYWDICDSKAHTKVQTTQRWFGPLVIIRKRHHSGMKKMGPKYQKKMICFPRVFPWKSYQNVTVLWC